MNLIYSIIIASEAALGMDRHLRGTAKESDYNAVQKLSEKILETSSKQSLDPLDVGMYSQFVWPNQDLRGKTTEDLRLQLHLFQRDLSSFEDLSRERQEELRSYCVGLSRAYQGLFGIGSSPRRLAA